jgi:hypothetical protein
MSESNICIRCNQPTGNDFFCSDCTFEFRRDEIAEDDEG